jgi:hypothetical protein
MAKPSQARVAGANLVVIRDQLSRESRAMTGEGIHGE